MDPVLLTIVLLHLAVPASLFLLLTDVSIQAAIVPCILLSIGAFITTLNVIPSIGVMTAAAGLSGKDLNKKDGKIMYAPTRHQTLHPHLQIVLTPESDQRD